MKWTIPFVASVALVHASPPLIVRETPKVGSDCKFDDSEKGSYAGTVTKKDDCKGAVSFWIYGPKADVQCCVRTSCDRKGDQYPQALSYSCMNTYKTEDCSSIGGSFVAGYCIGDKTVQCCAGGRSSSTDSSSSSPSTEKSTYRGNSVTTVPTSSDSDSDDGTSSTDQQSVPITVLTEGVRTTDQNAVVVPTIPGHVSSNPNAVVVPTYPGQISSNPNAVVVPTYPGRISSNPNAVVVDSYPS